MHILTLDFETYWTKPAEGYTLSKMPASLYVMDPRFKAHGVAVKLDAGPSKWVTHDDIPAFFDAVPWKKVFVLGQNNAGFDALILEWIYGSPAARVHRHDLDGPGGARRQGAGLFARQAGRASSAWAENSSTTP
jgi:hypothetical protein